MSDPRQDERVRTELERAGVVDPAEQAEALACISGLATLLVDIYLEGQNDHEDILK